MKNRRMQEGTKTLDIVMTELLYAIRKYFEVILRQELLQGLS